MRTTVRPLMCIWVFAVVAGTALPAHSMSVAPELVVRGPLSYQSGVPQHYFARVSDQHVGLPGQPVAILLDGAPATSGITGADGRFDFDLTLAGTEPHRIRATMVGGTGVEIASADLTVLPMAAFAGMEAGAGRIAAGVYHTCAVMPDTTVWCWGSNGFGQLGDRTTASRRKAVEVLWLSGAVAVTAGEFHTCALKNDGTVWCWGKNLSGQLGTAGVTSSTAPLKVEGITALAISAGASHTCAIVSDRSVRCWGDNYFGQLGNDAAGQGGPTAVTVNGVDGATGIGGTYNTTCAVTASGSVECWGKGDTGQLGGGGLDSRRARAETVPIPPGAAAVSAGVSHACAALSDGSVWCWGDNSYGARGDDTVTGLGGVFLAGALVSLPTEVSALMGAATISSGEDNSCAVVSDGSARCWGNNVYGQLGNGSLDWSARPVGVSGLSDVQAIATGGMHSCALVMDGRAFCWGKNSSGQLGDGSTKDSGTPVQVVMS
jgi:alpha-tubulin suppressor-like RCC1 family protein